MKVSVDMARLAMRARSLADRTTRDLMQRSGVVLVGEDRDAVHRLVEDVFQLGFLAAIEDVTSERTVRDGVAVVRAVDRRGKK